MGKHWKRALTLFTAAAAVALVSAGLALAKRPQPPEPPPEPELPNVRYRIHFPALPWGSGVVVKDLNNLGYVGGWYGSTTGNRMAFLYDPTVDQVFDVNSLIAAGLPEGWHFASIEAINDWLVAVGYIHRTDGDNQVTMPVAIDLAMPNPVIDLLPDSGADFQMAVQINENGDIVGFLENADGDFEHWVFNPGYYGDPLSRNYRDGTPLDMSGQIPELLPVITHWGNAYVFRLNNPVGDRPAQVAGTTLDGVVFRYTLGDGSPEFFPELDNVYGGINDAGTLSGRIYVPRHKKNPGYFAPYRYNPSWAEPLEILPQRGDGSPSAQIPNGINSSGDLLYSSGEVYRDDWGYVKIDDLVVGTLDDLALWFSEGGGPATNVMNDRAGQVDAAQIAGRITVTGAQYPVLFILTPEPAPPDE